MTKNCNCKSQCSNCGSGNKCENDCKFICARCQCKIYGHIQLWDSCGRCGEKLLKPVDTLHNGQDTAVN